jgi:importin subunit alpha-6/7
VVINSGVVPNIVGFLAFPLYNLVVPSLRILGNISTGTTSQTESLLLSNALPELEKLLSHPKKKIRRETCWVLSNIAAGSKEQVEALLKLNSLVKKLVELFQSDKEEIKL